MSNLTQAWLDLQCRMLSGIAEALVLPAGGSGLRGPDAVWPSGRAPHPRLSLAAQKALASGKEVTETPGDHQIIACPLFIGGRIQAVVAMDVSRRDETQRRALLQSLRWGAFWLELMLRQQEAATGRNMMTLFELIEDCLAHERAEDAATALVNQLATRLRCRRVSLGFLQRKRVEVTALSHNARFDHKSTLIHDIGACMEEAADQDMGLCYPPRQPGVALLTNAHARLAGNDGALCTVLMSDRKTLFGGITFERPRNEAFDDETLALCEAMAGFAGPILALKRREQTSLLARIRKGLSAGITLIFGEGHTFAKGVTVALALVVAGLILIKPEYRISADASLKGQVQRVVVAPVDGFVAEASVRPGDTVKQGQLLCRMDDRDLSLERIKLSGEEAKLNKEYREALAKHESAQASILKAKLDRAKAELDLAEEKLRRSRLVAPIDGVVVSGDLSQAIGAPLERGQQLFEIAPLDAYRIEMEVEEKDIGQIAPGQTGRLVLTGHPDLSHAFAVERITPVSEARDGANYFRVEGHLEQATPGLRPGMEGVAKVEVGKRSLGWILGHELVDWLRLKLWAWGL